MKWEIELTGDPADLALLSKATSGGQTTISRREDDVYVLRSSKLDECGDIEVARTLAKKIVITLSAYSRLKWNGQESIGVGTGIEFRDDGVRSLFLKAEPARARCRGFLASLSVTRRDGTVEHDGPSDTVQDWLSVAERDSRVAKVLRLRDTKDLGWVELYRIYEVVEDAEGKSRITSSGWINNSQVRLFKHTANSVQACGDQARHGKEHTDPPENPMTLPEAKNLIDSLVRSWITSKTASQTHDRPVH